MTLADTVTTMSSVQSIISTRICQLLQFPAGSIDVNSSFVNLGGHSLLAMKLANALKSNGIKLSTGNILLSKSITELINAATVVDATKFAAHGAPIRRPSIQVDTNISSHDRSSTQYDATKLSPLHRRPSVQFDTSIFSTRRPSAAQPDVAKQYTRRRSSAQLDANYISPMRRASMQVGAANQAQMTDMQLSFLHSYKSNLGTNIINFYETYNASVIPQMKKAWKRVIESEPIFRMSFDSIDSFNLVEKDAAPFKWSEYVVDSEEEYQAELVRDARPKNIECSFDVVNFRPAGISTIIWRVHHAFIDGTSAQLVYDKVRSALMGQEITPGPSFASVAKGLREFRESSKESYQQFWKEQLAKHPQATGHVTLPDPSQPAPEGVESISFSINNDDVTTAARRAGVSVASWYQAAWAMVLSMYSDSDSVVFGTIFSGRDMPVDGAEDTIGPLINTLPFHVSIDRKLTTIDYLRTVFRHLVELNTVQNSLPEDGYTRDFGSALAMEFEMQPADDHEVRPTIPSWFRVLPDIALSIYTSFQGTLRVCYKPQKFNKVDMELLAAHFRNAITLLLSPERTMGDCMSNLLTDDCRNTLMEFGNCNNEMTSLSYVDNDLVTLFERVAREHPETIAVDKAGTCLTYAELDRQASVLALRLQEHIEHGEVVCVHADRSINWIVAIWGVLKAGGVYSAQDADLPAHIRSMNFESADAKIFLTPTASQKDIKPEACQLCLSVDELTDMIDESFVPTHRAAPQLDDNAYLCFTSGSTGKPKGVMCHHAGLVAFQKDFEIRLYGRVGQRVSQLMSPAFDGSIHEIFSALCYGGTLMLTDGMDPFAHLRRSNAAILTPSVAKILDPEDFPDLQTVYLVGEPVPQYVNDVWSKATNLYNMYGPTEATCGATIQKLQPGRHVTIGPPNPTTRIYILDRNQQLVPPGVVGEIYCAGVQVARGYIGRPDLNAERFLPDTICGRGEMMYRTGDRAFFNHLGEVECLGRNDRQVKLRGYRTDLNDIEARVAQAITESTAVAICPNDDYLDCMIQPETLNAADVRQRIMKFLPTHAVPRHIMVVERFPMTPAGKIDYKEIANRSVKAAAAEEAKPVAKSLTTKTEIVLAQAWRELLNLSSEVEIDGDSNFVNLGGHSVMQLRLASKLSNMFAISVPVSKIIQAANLCELAKGIDELCAGGGNALKLVPLGRNKVSPIEIEWMEKYDLEVGTSAFNVTFACELDEEKIDVDHLVACWNAVLARHHIFRSRYRNDAEGVRRAYAKSPPQVMEVAQFNLWKEVNRPFALDRQHPIRVAISRTQMLASMSHIIADLTSLQVVLKEVMTMYSGAGLGPVKRRYHETTQWSRPATVSQMEWWTNYLEGISKESRHYSIPKLAERHTYGGQTHLNKLPTGLARGAIQWAEQNNVTLHQMALAAVSLAIQTDRDDTDVVLGGPYFNRGNDDLETVGLFLEPIPIRVKYANDGKMDSVSFVRNVQEASQSAIANAIPWEQLLKAMGEDMPEFPNHPLLDVMITFHDDRNSPKLPIDGIDPLITYTKGSKFALLAEFCAISNNLVLLRLEHDTKCIPASEISKVEGLIIEALRLIVDGYGYADIKERLRILDAMPAAHGPAPVNYFGTKMSDFRN